MEWLLVTLKSLPILKYFFEKFESYIILPLQKWYKDYEKRQLEKKYKDILIKEENSNTTIEIERSKPDSSASDEAIRNAHRDRRK